MMPLNPEQTFWIVRLMWHSEDRLLPLLKTVYFEVCVKGYFPVDEFIHKDYSPAFQSLIRSITLFELYQIVMSHPLRSHFDAFLERALSMLPGRISFALGTDRRENTLVRRKKQEFYYLRKKYFPDGKWQTLKALSKVSGKSIANIWDLFFAQRLCDTVPLPSYSLFSKEINPAKVVEVFDEIDSPVDYTIFHEDDFDKYGQRINKDSS
jgi:hypothetical protein